MKKKFPQTLYVKQEVEKNDYWLNPGESLFDLAELGEKVKVGVYNLVEIREIETVINSEKISK